MRSSNAGTSTSAVEILNISTQGIWLYVKGREYFLSHKEFPWFREARLSQISKVALRHGHHLHWPDLDVDLEIDSLEHTEHYPLKYI